MKKLYTLACILITSVMGFSQNYEFGLVHLADYNFKVVAIPDFTSSGNTDVSDVGFTLVLPAGSANIVNETTMLSGRTFNVTEYDAAFLTSQGLGDGTKDVFNFNMPPGQSILSHTAGEQIDLVSFQVSNMPTSGSIYFLLNSDPIATGASGVLDSFYNSDIDGPGTGAGTTNYFSGIATGMDSFQFSTLTVEELSALDNKISIHPNPTSTYINIETPLEVQNVQVFDALGKQVLDTTVTNNIKVKNLTEGMYLVKINTPEGTITKRILKK